MVNLKWNLSRMKYNVLRSISAILADKGIQLKNYVYRMGRKVNL